jgi:hypothetical protein
VRYGVTYLYSVPSARKFHGFARRLRTPPDTPFVANIATYSRESLSSVTASRTAAFVTVILRALCLGTAVFVTPASCRRLTLQHPFIVMLESLASSRRPPCAKDFALSGATRALALTLASQFINVVPRTLSVSLERQLT